MSDGHAWECYRGAPGVTDIGLPSALKDNRYSGYLSPKQRESEPWALAYLERNWLTAQSPLITLMGGADQRREALHKGKRHHERSGFWACLSMAKANLLPLPRALITGHQLFYCGDWETAKNNGLESVGLGSS
jgi:hypothetical protein